MSRWPVRTLEDRFWSHVDKSGECWLWTASVDRKGYGQFQTGNFCAKAHRVAWVLMNGPIPDELDVLHDCPGGDNPACVRHLWLGTNLDNIRDMQRKGRGQCGDRNGMRLHPEIVRRGERNWAAKLTAEQIREMRRRYRAGEQAAPLASAFGVKRGTVYAIVNGHRWAHIV